uniref:GPI ethanolamine phosphate transferase 3 n=1 Tax=Panagrolaimus sp. PS1159 TaxID=55785 RepID=A0AC35G7X6_9BILA
MKDSRNVTVMLLPRICLISTAFITALLIFQKGFLLKRQVLPNKSQCSDVIANPFCWSKPSYNKTIWLIIDALRHDFILPIDSTKISYNEKYFHGQMPAVSKLLESEPLNARLFHFIADAPTTTLQRLKALTTGTLPTFIEAGDNFGGTEILEDNIIDQIKSSGKNITFIGDDTWISLYPRRFNREYPAPSFDIKDLHTVDNVVISKIYDEISRDDWTLLIGHCLGVDHCGHRYGPNHPEMAKKLQQMDLLIGNLIKEMSEDTLLIVMGDHGMTPTGDHGGDSSMEVEAALFVYSKRGLPLDTHEDTVAQIDFVPTLSLLLDIPIPFSNLGSIISSLIPADRLTHFLKINCMQIIRFAQTYIQHEPSVTAQLDWVLREFDTDSSHKDDSQQSKYSIHRIQQVLREIWTSFDIEIARIGLIALFEATFFTLVHVIAQVSNVQGDFYGNLSPAIWLFRSGVFLLQLSLFIAGKNGENDLIIPLLNVSLILSLGYHLIVFIVQLLSLRIQWKAIIPFIIAFGHSATFLSNSFIVYEPSVIRFCLQTIIFTAFWEFLKKNKNTRKPFSQIFWNNKFMIFSFTSVTVAIRFGAFFERCREEQINCVQSVFVSTLSSLPLDSAKVLRILFGISSLIALNFWLRQKTLLFSQKSPSLRIISALSWPAILCISLHWLCEFLSANLDNFSLRTAQIVYGYFILVSLFSGFCLSKNEFFQVLFHSGSLVISMILGDGITSNLFALIYINEFAHFAFNDIILRSFFSSLLISHGFFSLAHTSTLAQIPWQAAFIGIPGNFPYQAIPGSLVFLHLFASIVILQLHDFSLDRSSTPQIITLIAFSSFKATFVSLAAFIHRRHLMLFKVFAPKFIFEGIGFVVLCCILFMLSLLKSLKKRG